MRETEEIIKKHMRELGFLGSFTMKGPEVIIPIKEPNPRALELKVRVNNTTGKTVTFDTSALP